MFIESHEYERSELLQFVGSRQSQSGIIWGKKDESCVIITSGGKGGESLGYTDKKNDDGSFVYIGQGSKGDQDPTSFANSLLVNKERSVLLFTTEEPSAEQKRARNSRRKLYNFEGIYEVVSWNLKNVKEGKRVGDKLIEFLLFPANNIYNTSSPVAESDTIVVKRTNLKELRAKVKTQNSTSSTASVTVREYIKRSRDVVQYALTRANGVCEYCTKPGPFEDMKGNRFLEVHHIFRLSDDGPDAPENVAAICPNCHREAHFGVNKQIIRDRLYEIVQKIEYIIDNPL